MTDILQHGKTYVTTGTHRKQLFPMCHIHTTMQPRAAIKCLNRTALYSYKQCTVLLYIAMNKMYFCTPQLAGDALDCAPHCPLPQPATKSCCSDESLCQLSVAVLINGESDFLSGAYSLQFHRQPNPQFSQRWKSKTRTRNGHPSIKHFYRIQLPVQHGIYFVTGKLGH